jgi:hypothetical protein
MRKRDDHLLAYQQIIEREPRSNTHCKKVTIIFENFGTPVILLFYSVSGNANSMIFPHCITKKKNTDSKRGGKH